MTINQPLLIRIFVTKQYYSKIIVFIFMFI